MMLVTLYISVFVYISVISAYSLYHIILNKITTLSLLLVGCCLYPGSVFRPILFRIYMKDIIFPSCDTINLIPMLVTLFIMHCTLCSISHCMPTVTI